MGREAAEPEKAKGGRKGDRHQGVLLSLTLRWGQGAWAWGAQRVQGCGVGVLSDSLGFTLQGRQKLLCVQALTSSATSHPTPPGPFKKKKNSWVGWSWGGGEGSP